MRGKGASIALLQDSLQPYYGILPAAGAAADAQVNATERELTLTDFKKCLKAVQWRKITF